MATTKRLSALLATFIAAAFALVAMIATPAANAADTSGNFDPAEKGSITVHKYENPTWPGVEANGNTVDVPEGAVALEGVEFTLTKLDIDLTESTNWENLTPEALAKLAADPDFTAQKGTTDAAGELPFRHLPVGVYKLSETAPGNNNIVAPAADSYIVLPLPQGENGWLYDIHVYPKNVVSQKPAKTVNDEKAFISGDNVSWTITQVLPKVDEFTELTVTDEFAEQLSDVAVAEVKVGETVLAAKDYTWENNVLTLTDSGLGKLVQDATFSVTFNSKVVAPGAISNTATVSVNDLPLNTDAVQTDWANLTIKKVDESGAPLEGAKFDVKMGDSTLTNVTTDADGKATVLLKVADGYTVTETAAPAGYKLDETVKTVNLTLEGVTLTVENQKASTPALPVTGASGQLLMTIGGAALLLMAAGTALVVVRRRS